MTNPRLFAVIAIGAMAVATLAGCAHVAAAPSASPRPSSTVSPTPTPTPEPYLATLTLNAESMVAADQNGQTIATVDHYTGRGADVAAQLTGLFGFAPAVEVVAPIASDFAFSGTKYDWEGFELRWYYGYEDDPTSTGRILIAATVPAVRGVVIQGTDGVRVGDGAGDLSTRYPGDTGSYEFEGRSVETATVNCVEHPEISSEAHDGIPRNCVAVSADPAEGPVTAIQVPAPVDYGM